MFTTSAPRYVRLSWTDPATGHELVRLAQLPVTLGRAVENTISLNSRSVSRQHAQIEQAANGEVVLIDRTSSNGTFLDGQRITRAALREGASFQIGPFVFSVSFLLAAEAQAAALQQPFPMPLRAPASTSSSQDEATFILQNDASTLISSTLLAPGEEVFPPASFRQPFVSVQQLRGSRLSLTETTYLAIGGGMGKFCLGRSSARCWRPGRADHLH
jgi:predicted component of type VI protein secretion system